MTKLQYRYVYYKSWWLPDGGIRTVPCVTDWVDTSPFQFKQVYGVKYNKFETTSVKVEEQTNEPVEK